MRKSEKLLWVAVLFCLWLSAYRLYRSVKGLNLEKVVHEKLNDNQ